MEELQKLLKVGIFPHRTTGRGKSILVVDDNEEAAHLTTMVLQQHGYEVVWLHDGISALHAARSMKPDLTILNNLMPGMMGLDVLHTLRRNKKTRHLKVVITSSAVRAKILARRFGAQGFLSCPYDEQDLLKLVTRILA